MQKANAVHQSDFIRWKILEEQGGLYSDTDILYIQCVDDLISVMKPWHHIGLCSYEGHNQNAIGFMMSEPHQTLFQILSKFSERVFNDKHYQSIGAPMLNSLNLEGREIFWVPKEAVYSVMWHETQKYLQVVPPLCISDFPGAIGFHLCGGAQIIGQLEASVEVDFTKVSYSGTLIGEICNRIHEAQ
jgi:hypothetical protein